MSSTNNKKPTSPTITPLKEPQKDEYQSFKKDPRLHQLTKTKKTPIQESHLIKELEDQLQTSRDTQDTFNLLRIFKKEQYQKIQKLESSPLENREKILNSISEVAKTILTMAYEETLTTMKSQYGLATYLSSSKQLEEAYLAVIAMGSMGALVMNYESDVDVIFVYSFLGEVQGKKHMTNREYFSKFAQKFNHMLSITTESGKCYQIDFELRPLGQAGTLVSTFDNFINHQMNGQYWEHMALLRSTPFAGNKDFLAKLLNHLNTLAFKRPIANDFFLKMNDVRQKVLNEKSTETPKGFDLKLATGTLMDIDFILHGLQLKNQILYKDLCLKNPFQLLEALHKKNLLEDKQQKTLLEGLNLFHTLISKLHLLKKRGTGFLALNDESFANIADELEMPSENLKEKIFFLRNEVHSLYKTIYENS